MTDIFENYVNNLPNDIIEGEIVEDGIDLSRLLDILLAPELPKQRTPKPVVLTPVYLVPKRKKIMRDPLNENGGAGRALIWLALFVGFIILLCIWILVATS